MIYITGDTHGDHLRFIENNMPGEDQWTKEDYLIVCGDFGYVFSDSKRENDFLDLLASKPYTICFCDGNHENFPRIYRYPEQTWNGGRVHRIRQNIVHLMRGQVFEICGKKILAMGGAYSIDKYMRINGLSWWKEELPNNVEYREATNSIKECDYKVDYIVTHTAPREIIRRMGKHPDEHDMELTGFLEWIMYEVKFKKWFFGHWHTDREIGDQFRAVWMDVVGIPTEERHEDHLS